MGGYDLFGMPTISPGVSSSTPIPVRKDLNLDMEKDILDLQRQIYAGNNIGVPMAGNY